jgi:hypothetical protein
MTKTYTVSLVRSIDDQVTVEPMGQYSDIDKAITAAKRASRTRKDCISYGPSSFAYVGREATAVVAW